MSIIPVCETCGAPLKGTIQEGEYCPVCILREGLLSTMATTSPEPSAEETPPIFASYELLEEIGRGGMGVVYKARQRSLKRVVAIKLLVSGAYSSESLLRRFQIEAESAASLQHPGIVAIHEFGEYDNQPFYTMEYVEGRNLSETAGGRPMVPMRAANYAKAIAEAVHYAHTRGILHRDLKPSNVLIDLNDRPRITDFGLAKQLHSQSDVSVAGQMLGSPNYAPPEQTAGKEVGVPSDVYSLGGLLYNLLTGRPPFMASTVQETLRLVAEAEPISPRTLNPDVPRDLETICLKCLEKDSARRYQSAQELGLELGRFLKHEPILARPVSKGEQSWRWCRRHPAIASLGSTTLIALTSTLAIFYNAAHRVEHARALENVARVQAEASLYAADMQTASQSANLVSGADPKAIQICLDSHRPKLGETDYRGFEWRYFWLQNKSGALASLPGHEQVIDAAMYSADGKRLATHSVDGVAKIWDATTLHELDTLEGVPSLGGFTADGGKMIFSHQDNSIWQLDLATNRASLIRSSKSRLIAALPDEKYVVTFGADQLPALALLTAENPAESDLGIPIDVVAVVSLDGRRAAVASRPGHPYSAVLVIDLATHQKIAAINDPRPVIALSLSPDGSELVTSGFDGFIKVWDVARGVQIFTLRPFPDPLWALAYSADGKSFACAGNNREIKLFNTGTWTEREKYQGHSTTVRCVAFSPTGNQLVSGAEDNVALVWPAHVTRLTTKMPQLLRGPLWVDRTPSIAFSKDSRFFAGTAADGSIKVWRTDNIQTVATFPMSARTVAFSPDGESVLGEGYNGIVRRWRLNDAASDGTELPRASMVNWQVDPLTPLERVTLVADQPETRAVCRTCEISSTRDGINAGAMLTTPTIAMAPGGKTMYVGLPDGRVEVWNVNSRKQLMSFSAHKLGVTSLAVSPDSQYLATGSLDNSTRLWETKTGNLLATFHAHNRPVWALAFSPDSRTLAAGSCDKEIILCSVPLRRHVAGLAIYDGSPKGYQEEVRLLRFSPDGNILAAGLGDGSVRFFRAAPFSETDAAAPNQSLASAL